MSKGRIISVAQAADIRGVTTTSIFKAVRSGKLDCVHLSGKALALSGPQVRGESYSKAQFIKECSRYISVPEACSITKKTDVAIIRDLKSGKIEGFRLNGKTWAVLKSSAEHDFRNYLKEHATRRGRKREMTQTAAG